MKQLPYPEAMYAARKLRDYAEAFETFGLKEQEKELMEIVKELEQHADYMETMKVMGKKP